MKTSRKGQAATETMVTIGMILVFVIPILLLLMVGAQARFEDLSDIQASSAARIISDSINEVYLEGPGASKIALVNLPTNIDSLELAGNEVIIRIQTRSGPSDTTASFFGVLDSSSIGQVTAQGGRAPVGLFPLKFSAADDGSVVIEHG